MRRLPPEIIEALASIAGHSQDGSISLDPVTVAKYIAGRLSPRQTHAVEAAAANTLDASQALLEAWREVESYKSDELRRKRNPFSRDVLREWLCETRLFGRTAAIRVTEDYVFLGRAHETAELCGLVSVGQHGLVTVTGPQGVGKTALVRHAVARIAHGNAMRVWWVDCDDSLDVDRLAAKISSEVDHVLAETGISAVTDSIGNTSALLVVDAAPQDPGVRQALGLLSAECPNLHLLVTSREPLGLAREQLFVLGPMASADATDLFLMTAEKAGRSIDRTGNADLTSLCEILGRVPKAIILTVDQLSSSTVDEILSRLSEEQPAPYNPDSIVSRALSTSFASLSTLATKVMRGVSVFREPYRTDEAAFVCGVNEQEAKAALGELCERSLASMDFLDAHPTYRTEDRWWPEEADSDEALEGCWHRYVLLFEKRAQAIRRQLDAGMWSEGIKVLNRHGDDIYAAIQYAIRTRWDDKIVSFADSISRVYFETGRRSEFSLLTGAALTTAIARRDQALEARMHGLLGAACSRRGDEAACTAHWTRRAELCAHLGDAENLADALGDLAGQAFDLGRYEEAVRLTYDAESKAHDAGVSEQVATARIIRARACRAMGDEPAARHWIDEAVVALREATNRDLSLYVYQSLAIIYDELGETELALQVATKALDDAIEGGRDVHVGLASTRLANLFEAQGNVRLAAFYHLQAANAHSHVGSRHQRRAEATLAQFIAKHGTVAQSEVDQYRDVPWQELLHSHGKR